MEGELAKTIEAIDGVDTAVVHLALPQKKVFADEQDPATASVLVDTAAGTTSTPEQVQAVVHLVASSIDGLDAGNVTVADSTGKVLSDRRRRRRRRRRHPQTSRSTDFQDARPRRGSRRCSTGSSAPGNSTVQVTADLDFDKAVPESTTYTTNDGDAGRSRSRSSKEIHRHRPAPAAATGVVGPDGQMDSTGTRRQRRQLGVQQGVEDPRQRRRQDPVEHRETAPGGVESLHVGVVLDTAPPSGINAGRRPGPDRRRRRHRHRARRHRRGLDDAVRPHRRRPRPPKSSPPPTRPQADGQR